MIICYKNILNTSSAVCSINFGIDPHLCKLRDTPAGRVHILRGIYIYDSCGCRQGEHLMHGHSRSPLFWRGGRGGVTIVMPCMAKTIFVCFVLFFGGVVLKTIDSRVLQNAAT